MTLSEVDQYIADLEARITEVNLALISLGAKIQPACALFLRKERCPGGIRICERRLFMMQSALHGTRTLSLRPSRPGCSGS